METKTVNLSRIKIVEKKVITMFTLLLVILAFITITPQTESKGSSDISSDFDYSKYPEKYSKAISYIDFVQSFSWRMLARMSAFHDSSIITGEGLCLCVFNEDGTLNLSSKYINVYYDTAYNYLGIEEYRQAYYAAYRALATNEEKANLEANYPGWERWWQENYWSEDYVFDFPSDSYFANTCYCNDFVGNFYPIYAGAEGGYFSSDLEFIRYIRASQSYFDFGMTPSTCSVMPDHGYGYPVYYVASKHDFVRVTDAPYFTSEDVFACKDEYLMLRHVDADAGYAIRTAARDYVNEHFEELKAKGEVEYQDGHAMNRATNKSKYVWPMGSDEPNEVESYLEMVYQAAGDLNGMADTKYADWYETRKAKDMAGSQTVTTPEPTSTPVPTKAVTDDGTDGKGSEATPTPEATPEVTAEPTPTLEPIGYEDIPVVAMPTDEPIVEAKEDEAELIDIEKDTTTPSPTAVPTTEPTTAPAEEENNYEKNEPWDLPEQVGEPETNGHLTIIIAGISLLMIGGILFLVLRKRKSNR